MEIAAKANKSEYPRKALRFHIPVYSDNALTGSQQNILEHYTLPSESQLICNMLAALVKMSFHQCFFLHPWSAFAVSMMYYLSAHVLSYYCVNSYLAWESCRKICAMDLVSFSWKKLCSYFEEVKSWVIPHLYSKASVTHNQDEKTMYYLCYLNTYSTVWIA